MLTLKQWDVMSRPERKQFGKSLLPRLPDSFYFCGIETCRLGDNAHHMARFEFEGSSFFFIPGNKLRLGYNDKRDWRPNEEEQQSWHNTQSSWGVRLTIHQYIRERTLRPRSASIAPFLMEATPREVGWESVTLSVAEARKMLGRHIKKETTIRRSGAITHQQLTADMAVRGFRFPTSDEWEYACGGGAKTLFRWGDHVPADRYPTDEGQLWDLHRRPNAFGITIAVNPYKHELVEDPHVVRGGDGGSTICGGFGFFAGWLPLATAYFEDDTCTSSGTGTISGSALGRRVFPLPGLQRHRARTAEQRRGS
jgi:hypothetical protein